METEGKKTNERHLDNRISIIHKHIPSHTLSKVLGKVSQSAQTHPRECD